MTYKILSKEKLAESITRMVVLAPEVSRNAQAGQFVAVIADENGERIPLTIADSNKKEGAITLIFQEAGYSTMELGRRGAGDSVHAVLGPLGKPTSLEKFGKVVCVGGGVGVAEMLPVARAYKAAGNFVIGIIGSRTKGLLILEKELSLFCDELHVATDDGSAGTKGFVTDVLAPLLQTQTDIALVYCIGPVPMMKSVAALTAARKIRTVVSLNPMMVDATGMCGACRCTVAGKTVFGCVDGPEFDAQEVDFDELLQRLAFFKKEESQMKDAILGGGSGEKHP